MQPLFQQNVSLTLRLLIITLLCIVSMTVDHRKDALQTFRSTVSSYLVYPLQYIVAVPSRMLNWAGQTLASRRYLLEENARLTADNLQLQVQQQQLASLIQENARLRELLNASSQVGKHSLIAEVLSVQQDYFKQQILLNKGAQHGVYLGQPVIDAKGVMGQIIEVNQHSSVTLLLSDPNHAIPVQNNRNGIRTIAQGKGHPNELDLLHIPNNTDIAVGDLMISSGLGKRFPPNYPVAIVTQVDVRPGRPFTRVTAKAAAHLNRSREVLLIWLEQRSAAEE